MIFVYLSYFGPAERAPGSLASATAVSFTTCSAVLLNLLSGKRLGIFAAAESHQDGVSTLNNLQLEVAALLHGVPANPKALAVECGTDRRRRTPKPLRLGRRPQVLILSSF